MPLHLALLGISALACLFSVGVTVYYEIKWRRLHPRFGFHRSASHHDEFWITTLPPGLRAGLTTDVNSAESAHTMASARSGERSPM